MDAGELEAGVTKRWGPAAHTEARARQLGVDLRHWPTTKPPTGWRDDAACRGADSDVADALTGALSQAGATELVTRWCSRCPVLQECFTDGRATRGHGVWGGIVLREGRVATWRTAAERSGEREPRSADVAAGAVGMSRVTAEILQVADDTAPVEDAELVGTAPIEAPKRRRGQRVQPRRRTRAERRRR